MEKDYLRELEVRLLYLLARLDAECVMLHSLTNYALVKGDVHFGLTNIIHQAEAVNSIADQLKKTLYPE
jgi:hypothetical protein